MATEPNPDFLPALLAEIEAIERDGSELMQRGEAMLAKARALRGHYDGINSVLNGTEAHPDIKPANTGRKGKQPGAMSEGWKRHLKLLYMVHGPNTFGRKDMRDTLGVEMAPSQVARQFSPYLAAGYLIEPATGRYKITEEGLRKIGLDPDGNGEASADPEVDHGGGTNAPVGPGQPIASPASTS